MSLSSGGFLIGTLDERSAEPTAAVQRIQPFPPEIRRGASISVRDWRYLNEEVRRLSGAGLIGIYRLTTSAEDAAETETDRKILEKYSPMGAKISVVIESEDCALAPIEQYHEVTAPEPARPDAQGPPAPTVTPGLSSLARGVQNPPMRDSAPAATSSKTTILIGAAVGLLLAAFVIYKVASGSGSGSAPAAAAPVTPRAPVVEPAVISNPAPGTPAPAGRSVPPPPAPVRQAAKPTRTPAQASIPEPKPVQPPNVAAPPALPTASPAAAVPAQASTPAPVAPPQPDRRGEALRALERDAKRQEALRALEAGAAEKAKRDAALKALGQK